MWIFSLCRLGCSWESLLSWKGASASWWCCGRWPSKVGPPHVIWWCSSLTRMYSRPWANLSSGSMRSMPVHLNGMLTIGNGMRGWDGGFFFWERAPTLGTPRSQHLCLAMWICHWAFPRGFTSITQEASWGPAGRAFGGLHMESEKTDTGVGFQMSKELAFLAVLFSPLFCECEQRLQQLWSDCHMILSPHLAAVHASAVQSGGAEAEQCFCLQVVVWAPPSQYIL